MQDLAGHICLAPTMHRAEKQVWLRIGPCLLRVGDWHAAIARLDDFGLSGYGGLINALQL